MLNNINKIVLLLILLVPRIYINSQTVSKKTALIYSQKLLDKEILSKKGHNLLNKEIQDNSTGTNSMSSSTIKTSKIIKYLTNAFRIDIYYRSGFYEKSKLSKEYISTKKDSPPTKDDYIEFQQKLDSILENFEGRKIEEKIKDEENFPEESRRISFSMFEIPNSSEHDLINHNRSVMGKHCTRTLKDLLSIGIINDTIYNEVLPKIERNELTFEATLISYIAERILFYENFEENKLKELSLIKRLYNNKVISEKNYEILKNNDGKILSKFDLLQYCEKAKIFQLKNYSTNQKEGYKELFKEIKLIVPQFEYSNLNINVYAKKNEWEDKLKEYYTNISFEVNNQTYSNEFFYGFNKNNNSKEDSILNVSEDFQNGINKLLVDLNSEKRLYFANSPERQDVYGNQQFGLILLTESQYKAWNTFNSEYFLFNQNHSNNFNTQNINKAIALYEELDLFKHLTKDEIRLGRDCIAKSNIRNYQDILSCFPNTIVYFDWETGNLTNPYEELTLAFAEASRGAFTIKKVKDNFEESFDKKSVNYSFKFKGKTYKKELIMFSDWLDPRFMKTIEQALEEHNIDGRFYHCIDDGQASGYIFLNKNQYQYLKEHQPELFSE